MGSSSLTVPATLESLTDLGAFVRKAAELAGLSPQAGYRLRLAVDELATNAITHGGAGAAGSINVRADLDDTTLTVIVEDSGAAFDPRATPAPVVAGLPAEQRPLGGLGIFLALSGVDRFSYERVEGRNRNILIVNRPGTPAQRS